MTDRDNPLLAGLLALAVVGISFAMQDSNGNLSGPALLAVTLALTATVSALVVSDRRGSGPGWVAQAAVPLLGAGLAYGFYALVTTRPGMYVYARPGLRSTDYYGASVLAALVVGMLASRHRWARVGAVAAMVVAHFFLGLWMMRAAPDPSIDVVVFHRDSIRALLHGVNPYGIDFPNIYGPGTTFYGENVVQGSRVLLGFPYLPLSLFLSTLGQLAWGDFRFAHLLAMEGAAVLIAFARPGSLGKWAAAALLFTPRTWFVLEEGWTEPLLVLAFAVVVFLACRRPRWVPYAVGALLALKQYLVFVLLLLHLLSGRPLQWREHLRRLAWSVGIPAVLTVPFALWNLEAFMRSVVLCQIRQPFRIEALSYLAEVARLGGPRLPSAVAFALALGAVGLSWRFARRSPAGFATAVSLVYLVFFAFNKQAFCNYYYFVLGTLCCALGSAALEPAV